MKLLDPTMTVTDLAREIAETGHIFWHDEKFKCYLLTPAEYVNKVEGGMSDDAIDRLTQDLKRIALEPLSQPRIF